MLDNEPRRRIVSIPVAFAFVALTVAACGGAGPEGVPDATVAGTVHVCSSCHGPDGRSISPPFPRLAGQQKDYLVAQLQASEAREGRGYAAAIRAVTRRADVHRASHGRVGDAFRPRTAARCDGERDERKRDRD